MRYFFTSAPMLCFAFLLVFPQAVFASDASQSIHLSRIKVGPHTAFIEWVGAPQSQAMFRYGKSIFLREEQLLPTGQEKRTVLLSALEPGTKYYYATIVQLDDGTQSKRIGSFQTSTSGPEVSEKKGKTTPVTFMMAGTEGGYVEKPMAGSFLKKDYVPIADVTVSPESSSALVTYETNKSVLGLVMYGPTSEYGFYVGGDSQRGARVKHHSYRLNGLEPGQEVHFSIKTRDTSSGALSQTADFSFATPNEGSGTHISYPDTISPRISNFIIKMTSATTANVSLVADKPMKTVVVFDRVPASKNDQQVASTEQDIVVRNDEFQTRQESAVEGLSEGALYRVVVNAWDNTRNETTLVNYYSPKKYVVPKIKTKSVK